MDPALVKILVTVAVIVGAIVWFVWAVRLRTCYISNVAHIHTPMVRLGEMTSEKPEDESPAAFIKRARKHGVWGSMAHSGQLVWIAPEMVKVVTFREE